MKRAIDARIIFKRGVGAYIASLIRNVARLDAKNDYIIFTGAQISGAKLSLPLNFRIITLPADNKFLYEQYLLPRAANREGAGLLHFTDNSSCLKEAFSGIKVVTLHDTMHTRPIFSAIRKPSAKQLLADAYNKVFIPAGAKSADAVITVSEASKKDIIRELKIDNEKVSVIYEAAREEAEEADNGVFARLSINTPYVLISAAADTRKNHERAIKAFALFNEKTGGKHSLVITSVGKKEMKSTNLESVIRKAGVRKKAVITGYVSDAEMAALYSRAALFFFPSLWEGFGLQVLEAFKHRTPVVTSANSSISEVAKEAALFADPYNIEEMARVLQRCAEEPGVREEMIKKGIERELDFSWEKTAARTLELYETLEKKGKA